MLPVAALLLGTAFTKNTLRFVWYLVTVMALGMAWAAQH
jgi:hypothetical protein